MQIDITKVPDKHKKAKPTNESALSFGETFTDHMFLMNYDKGRGWHTPRVVPFSDLRLSPAAMGLHYGQEIFEGLKAYRGKNGDIYLFRPRDNFSRLNASAARLCMPEVDIDLVMEGLKNLLKLECDWIPSAPGTSLYIRPFMLATEPHIGVRAAESYLFCIIIGPVGAYYKEGLDPIKIYVEDQYVRAAAGGTGEAKAAANYAASLFATEKAKHNGYAQVLWLDAQHHRYIEEVGTMNMFFVIDDEVITAPLNGTILPGITRDSVVSLLKANGRNVSQRLLSMEELTVAANGNSLQEAFGTGTAAVISPVGHIAYKGEQWKIADNRIGPLSQWLYDEIIGIQYGTKEDPFGWRAEV